MGDVDCSRGESDVPVDARVAGIFEIFWRRAHSSDCWPAT